MSISSLLIKISNSGLWQCALNYFFFQNIGCPNLFDRGCIYTVFEALLVRTTNQPLPIIGVEESSAPTHKVWPLPLPIK